MKKQLYLRPIRLAFGYNYIYILESIVLSNGKMRTAAFSSSTCSLLQRTATATTWLCKGSNMQLHSYRDLCRLTIFWWNFQTKMRSRFNKKTGSLCRFINSRIQNWNDFEVTTHCAVVPTGSDPHVALPQLWGVSTQRVTSKTQSGSSTNSQH